MPTTDIIAAIATPIGRGGIGVVRISGADLKPLSLAMLGRIPIQRHATLCAFQDDDGLTIDNGIALYFPGPHSYTGEDVLELQGHGGLEIMKLLLSRCLAVGARLARPGEFTLRAFLNNKIDLAQAESVSDIIDASSSAAARCAVRSLQGDFSAAILKLVDSVTGLRMIVEATLDFPEEETGLLHQSGLCAKLNEIKAQLECVLTSAKQGSLLREGGRVVLVGRPNVGKSSLMNRLAGDVISIVTEVPGTTRDTIRQEINLEGVSLQLIDTAGLRETHDPVEKIGIAHTLAAIENADLALLLMDVSSGAAPEDRAIVDSFPSGLPVIQVFNKIDILGDEPHINSSKGGPEIYLSAKTGAGVDLLRQGVLEAIGWRANPAGEGLFMARRRHLLALLESHGHLEAAAEMVESETQLELLAEELRLSQRSLSSITGEFSSDALLGEIFSRFCIGK